MLKNIRIVLINTSHPGNIGSAARAMKTMGLHELILVSPLLFPHDKAKEMASGAGDIVDRAIVVNTLEEAIADCSLVVGTSTRSRTISWPALMPRELAEKAIHESERHSVAILFGREQSGLTNEELHRCHFHVSIPTDSAYRSLNLAAAVQVIAYELQVAHRQPTVSQTVEYPLATAVQMETLFSHLERVMIDLDFLNPKAPRQLMTRLRRLFYRARIDTMEMNILRGILGSVEKCYTVQVNPSEEEDHNEK